MIKNWIALSLLTLLLSVNVKAASDEQVQGLTLDNCHVDGVRAQVKCGNAFLVVKNFSFAFMPCVLHQIK
mgnify:CR=1 FL=1